MPVPSRVDRQTFLGYLRQSGLVNEAQLADAGRLCPDSNRGRVLARALVEQGTLTRFQAERLLAGRTAGFHLGQYRILEQIGRGGMGRVFKAEHLTMKRVVALKVLSADLLSTERAVELFLHEVRAAARLAHPNIVTAYDANEVNGRYYLVLEYVDGPNLDQLVRARGPLSVGLACDYVRQASALDYAHASGVVHRDVKPANILVQWHGLNGEQSPGLVKISDFGLARLHAPTAPAQPFHSHPGTILTRDNTVMGTPDYLSPEQSRNLHKTDIRSDLYSLGCTFYFLLTGRVPFPGGTALDKLIRHSTERPEPVTDFRSDVPAPVLAVVERLLEKHPSDRYQTPAELADALAPYAVSGPTPWAPRRAPAPLDDGPDDEIQVELLADGDDIVPPSSGEMAVFTPTLGPDRSPTPRAPVVVPSRLVASLASRKSRRRQRWAVGIVVVVMALAAGAAAALASLAR